MSLSWQKSIAQFKALGIQQSKFAEKEIGEIVDNTAEFLKWKAKEISPVDTGRLRRSYKKISVGKGSKRKVTVFNDAVDPVTKVYYPILIEHGQPRTAPRRFFKKSVDAAEIRKKKWLKQLGKELQKEFNKGI